MADFKKEHKADEGHFFDRKTMQFFNSRIESGLLVGGFFITSEQYDENTERFYAVRQIGERPRDIMFMGRFSTKEDAKDHVKNLRNDQA